MLDSVLNAPLAHSSTGNKLHRNGSSHGFGRSFSSFFLLLSVVILISLFYLYFSTSSELQSFRSDYDELNAHHLKLKNEMLDVNLKMEALKKSDSDCKLAKDTAEAKVQACQKELSGKSTLLAQIETHKTDCEGTINELKDKLKSANDELAGKATASKDQNSLVANLTQTIEQLKMELEKARSSATVTEKLSTPANELSLGQPKPTTSKSVVEGAKDTAHENDSGDQINHGAHDKQNADFIAPKRSPGGRVQLAEQAEQREKFSNHKDLLKAAAKLDKQQEKVDEADNDEKPVDAMQTPPTGEKAKEKANTEKNRPLVDGE